MTETPKEMQRGTSSSRQKTILKAPGDLDLFPLAPGYAKPGLAGGDQTTELLQPISPLPASKETPADVDLKDLYGRKGGTVPKKLEEFFVPETIGAKAHLIVMCGQQVGRMYELGDDIALIGRSHDATISITDEAVSRYHAQIQSSTDGFLITDLQSTNGLYVNAVRVQTHVLQDGDRLQFGTSTVLKYALQDDLEESLQRRLYEGATRDHLVDAHNRQYLVDSLDAAFATATRRDRPLSTLMLDIDHFKRINDTWGHLAGDFILKGVANLVRGTIRTEDVFARFGGEEFVLVLTESDREASLLVAERIRSELEARVFEYEGESLGVTISIGVATYASRNYPTPKDLIGAADTALYEAKRGGRNRVVWSERAPTVAPRVDSTP